MTSKNLSVLASLISLAISMTATGCVVATEESSQAWEEMQGEESSSEAVAEEEQALLACDWEHTTAYTQSVTAPNYWYTPTYYTSSGCGHLWVQGYWQHTVKAFIRYYPSGGGYQDSAVMDVKYNQFTQFSNSVFEGTKFRVYSNLKTEFVLDR